MAGDYLSAGIYQNRISETEALDASCDLAQLLPRVGPRITRHKIAELNPVIREPF